MRFLGSLIAVLGLVLGSIPGAAAQNQYSPITLEPNFLMQWPEGADGATFQFGDFSMALDLVGPKDADWIDEAILTITRPGSTPFRVQAYASNSGFGQIGIFDLTAGGAPTLVFESFSGGAHCCMDVKLVTLDEGPLKVVDLGMFDGGLVEPIDLDGDGVFEFLVNDDRFNYTFDAYAFSSSPPLIYAMGPEGPYDASREARFRSIYVDAYNQLAPVCIIPEGYNAGGCAAYLGAAARLGIYEGLRATLAPALSQMDMASGWEEYSFCLDQECETQKEFTDLMAAVEYALGDWGYFD